MDFVGHMIPCVIPEVALRVLIVPNATGDKACFFYDRKVLVRDAKYF